MGRRRNPIKKLKKGSLYFLDRRYDYLSYFKKVLSRQKSKNYTYSNRIVLSIKPSPVSTSLLVLEHDKFFGTEYVYALIADTEGTVDKGWITLREFLRAIKGEPIWDYQAQS